MPIEFACESCTKLLRVPDGTGGRSCECPACGNLLEIPDPNAIEVVEVVDESSPPNQTVAVACPKCRQTLVCPKSLLGTKGQCRNCKYIFLISTDPHAAGSAAEAEDGGVVFSCPKCDQLFDGKEEMRGRKGKCHVCGEVFQIELKPTERRETAVMSRAEVEAAQGRRKKQNASTSRAPAMQTRAEADSSAPIQIACPKCQGIMEVPGSAAGQSTACPFCEQLLQIPAALGRAKQSSARQLKSPSPQDAPQQVPQASSQENLWAELGDLSGAAEQPTNPYQSPAPVFPSGGESAWTAPRAAKQFRGLTFSNAFGLMFDTAFPSCLAAPAILLAIGLICFLFILVGGFAGGFFVSLVKPQSETSAYTIIFAPIVIAALISICFVTAGICMTCNTALHAVRRKRITASVIFGTGNSYGGVLVLVLAWTLLNAFQRFGIPWIVSSYVESGQRETAVMVALSLIGLVFLIQLVMYFLCSTAPFAMLDGHSLPDALQESAGILFSNFFTVTGVIICGSLLYVLVSIVSCGLGALLLIGMQVFLMAAVYHLADK